jgi:enoyl-CoA hydratase/carnithine racemase
MEHPAETPQQAVTLEILERTAVLTLNRPAALNAMDEQVLAGLSRGIAAVHEDQRVKALVITGAGEAFCVGLDIELLGRAFEAPSYFRDVLDRLKETLLHIEQLPVPVIAAVNGLARAGGFEIALACDLVLVAEDARIGDTHLAFGIVPGGGAVARAPRKLGSQRARELLLTGRWMDGREAAEIGFALRAVPRERIHDEALALAERFANLSRPALAATKAAIVEGESLPLHAALDAETERFMAHLLSEDTAAEGYRAFVEKRTPEWP